MLRVGVNTLNPNLMNGIRDVYLAFARALELRCREVSTAEKAASCSGFRVKVGMRLIWGLGFRVPMSRNPEYLL